MKKKLLLLLCLPLLFSCSKAGRDAHVVEHSNDFESTAGWGNCESTNSLTRDRAHSGKYSLKVDEQTEFSMGFKQPLGLLSPFKPKKVEVEAWVFVPDKNQHATLVVQVHGLEQGQPDLLWKGLDIANEVDSYNQWEQVAFEVDLPEEAGFNHLLNVHLWRTDATMAIYLDNIKIKLKD